jgi:hypothetical protein
MRSIARSLIAEMLVGAPSPRNNFCAAGFFASWFQTELPPNSYAWLVSGGVAPKPAPRLVTTLLLPPVKPEPVDDDDDDTGAPPRDVKDFKKPLPKRQRTQDVKPDVGMSLLGMEHVLESVRSGQTTDKVFSMRTRTSSTRDQESVAVLRMRAYDGRSKLATDSVARLYNANGTQEQVVDKLQRSMDARFGGGVRDSAAQKVAQVFLVLALEPIDLALNLRLRRRLPDDFIVDNVMHMARATQIADGVRKRTPGYDDSVEEASRRRVRDVFGGMSISLFSRFPELAIACDDTSSLPLLRIIASLWAVCGSVFRECAVTQVGESANEFEHNSVFQAALEPHRAALIAAAACANIEGVGYELSFHAKELALVALDAASLRITQLLGASRRQPPFARYSLELLDAARTTLAQARSLVQVYAHSHHAHRVRQHAEATNTPQATLSLGVPSTRATL